MCVLWLSWFVNIFKKAENQKLLDEKKQFEKIVEELKGTEQELTGLLQTREVCFKGYIFLSHILLVEYRLQNRL